MNAGTGNEPESPKRRGRIPQSAWPRILERYRAGATLSAIAREFECTPSAISYIVRKAEAAGMTAEGDTAEAIADEPAEAAPPADVAAPQTAEPAAAEAPPEPAPVAVPSESAPAEAPAAEPAPVEATAADPTPEPPKPTAEPPKPTAEAPKPAAAPRPERLRLEMPRAEAKAEPKPEPKPEPATEPPRSEATAAPSTRTAARPEPTPPIDAVEGRLRETARVCLSAYRSWRQQPGENSIQALSDSVHELRKALARIEIDMSASRRDEQAIRPIPIPAHRASRRPQ